MSTGSSTQPATYPATGPQSSGLAAGVGASKRSFWRLRDARIRSKLGLILLVPLVAVLALATVRLIDVGTRAYDAGQVEELTKLSANVSELTQYMHNERMAAGTYLSSPASDPKAYNIAIQQTDARIQTYTTNRRAISDPPPAVEDRLNRIDDHMRTMDATRQKVLDRNEIGGRAALQRGDHRPGRIRGIAQPVRRRRLGGRRPARALGVHPSQGGHLGAGGHRVRG